MPRATPNAARHRNRLIAASTLLALVAAACGKDSTPTSTERTDTSRTIEIEMVDIGFKPTSLEVKKGETIRFRFTNDGKVAHDAFVGDEMAQADHEQEMSTDTPSMGSSGMDHGSHGGDDNAITVEPGTTGELTYTFRKAGSTQIGCHEPGHYAQGMKIDVTVT